MASRNASGGLSLASSEASDVLDSFGFDIIIFETLGVGQVEVDVMNETDTVAVVLVPESGDDIQMMKSGLIEIADIYVVNKSDRSGSDRLLTTLNNMLDTNPSLNSKWRVPVLKTNALNNEGTDELISEIQAHLTFIKKEEILKEKINDRYQRQIKSIIQNRYDKYFWTNKSKNNLLSGELSKDIKDRISPIDLVEKILKDEKY